MREQSTPRHPELTKVQRRALRILTETGQPGVLTSGVTDTYDGQAYVNVTAARALREKRLVRIDYGNGEVTLGDNRG